METKSLTLIQLNDIHGYLNIHSEIFIENGVPTYRNVGGYPRIATLLNQIRTQNPEGILTFDNGDTLHGTYYAVQSKGEALIPILNTLNIDAMTAHWEFAYGPTQFQKIVSQLNYPMLASNCYSEKSNELIFPSHTIIQKNGINVGVIGIAAHIIDKTMPPHFSEGVYFTLGNEELPELIDQLRTVEKVDIVVVLSHLGFPQEVKLAREVDGIDILLSSHTHNRLAEPVLVNDTIIIQSGSHGSFIGRLDVDIQDGKIMNHKHELIEVSEEIPPNQDMQAFVNDVLATDQKMLDTVIGYTEKPLDRYGQLETTMDNLLLKAMIHASGVEIAFSNGWRYGAPIVPGPITNNDLWNIIPTNPPISLVEITGREIINMLEENLEHTFASDPYEQMGGYVKRCLGIKLYVKLENPNGTRVQDLFVGYEPINKKAVYEVAFVTEQGIPKKYGKNRRNLDINAIDALKNYIEKEDIVCINLHGTVKVM